MTAPLKWWLDWNILHAIYDLSHQEGVKGHFPGDTKWLRHPDCVHIVAVEVQR